MMMMMLNGNRGRLLMLINIVIAAIHVGHAAQFNMLNNEDETPSCQTILVVDDRAGDREVEYGTYLYRNLTPPVTANYFITREAQQWIDSQQWLCTVVSSVVTDDVFALKPKMEAWLSHECQRINLGDGSCVVKDMTGKFQTKRYKYNKNSPNEGAKVFQLTTHSPTSAPSTPVPTVPLQCTLRTNELDCTDDVCQWFGAVIGCQPNRYCGFKTSTACLARWKYCEWRAGNCRAK